MITPSYFANFMRDERRSRRLSTAQLAEMVRALARERGEKVRISQQTISGFEQGKAKRMPDWWPLVAELLSDESTLDERIEQQVENYVQIAELPTFAGAGGGGTGDGDHGTLAFSRAMVEQELRAKPEDLVAVTIEGNSMHPDYQSGDQMLIDKRKTSIAQPGAFCLWDGDGYVVKYVERVPDSSPAKLRLISANDIYSTSERLVEEVRIMGRVVWFARRV